jgi:hypothetical protein
MGKKGKKIFRHKNHFFQSRKISQHFKRDNKASNKLKPNRDHYSLIHTYVLDATYEPMRNCVHMHL